MNQNHSFSDSQRSMLISILNIHLPGYSVTFPFHLTDIHSSTDRPTSIPSPSPSPLSGKPNNPPSFLSPESSLDSQNKISDADPIDTVVYDPIAFLSDFETIHNRKFAPEDLNQSTIATLLSERISDDRAWNYLASCWARLSHVRATDHAADPYVIELVDKLILTQTKLLLQYDELAASDTPHGARQLVTWMSLHCDSPASSLNSLLKSVLDSLNGLEIPAMASSIFASVQADMREQTLIHADHSRPIAILLHLLQIPALARAFVTLPNFIYPLFNGYKIETDSPLGQFLRLTALPDEPSVGERYFNAPLHMTEMERLFCMSRLNRKLDKAQELICQTWHKLLMNDDYTRTALLTWVSTMLLSNWGRTRMRSQRKTTSNDGFLLNVASIMLRISDRLGMLSVDHDNDASIDPWYCLLPSRLDVKDETKICATTSDESSWMDDFYLHAKRLKSQINQPVMQDSVDSITDADEKDDRIGGDDSDISMTNCYNNQHASPSSSTNSVSAPGVSKFKRARLSFGNSNNDDNSNVSSSHVSSVPFEPELTPIPMPVLNVGDMLFSSQAERDYMFDSLSIHYGIVCDKCRVRDLTGVRFKCAQCKDYDLCANCERRDFETSLGLESDPGPTFPCPYPGCDSASSSMTEIRLRDHVHAQHSTDLALVTCPICVLQGATSSVMSQPRFDTHLSRDHYNEHDCSQHQMMKIHAVIPLMHKKFFKQQNTIPVTDFPPEIVTEAIQKFIRPPLIAQHVQATAVHIGTRCLCCTQSPIVGIAYRCSQCPDLWLCSHCESLGYRVHKHQHAHIFIQYRRPVAPDAPVPSPERIQYPQAVLGSFGFSLHTEWFFLTLHTLHVGMLKTCSRYTSLVQSIEQESDPRKLDSFMKVKLCVDAQLLHPRLLKDTLAMYNHVARWMTSIIDPAHQSTGISLPLPSTIPMEFAALPEYLIEDMADFMLFLSRFSIDTMDTCDVLPILHLFVALISATSYLNNPYLRAKLVEVFCGVSEHPTSHGPGCPALSSRLTSDPFVITHLIPALIRLYVDIEHTGSDSQFYDKFNVRHAIAVLAKFLSDFPAFVNRMEQEALDTDLFVRFTNSIINDMIYLLDEALIKAAQLHDIQQSIAATRAGGMSFTQAQQRRQEQERAQGVARSLRTAAVLATHTVNLLYVLCLHEKTAAVLLRPEMVDRITASINTYVCRIAGANRESILVKDAGLSNYHHDQWLAVFADIYLQFRDNEMFRLSIVKDSRCFIVADFKNAVEILREKKLRPLDGLQELNILIDRLGQLSDQVQNDWEELGDVPEEFLDPILNTLMEDPVLLPSGVAMDRAVITRHLLNKRLDPFNRQPLDVKDLVEATQLKNRIQEWKSNIHLKRAEQQQREITTQTTTLQPNLLSRNILNEIDVEMRDANSTHHNVVDNKRMLDDNNVQLSTHSNRPISLVAPSSLSASSSMQSLSSNISHPPGGPLLVEAINNDQHVWLSAASSSSLWQSQPTGPFTLNAPNMRDNEERDSSSPMSGG